MLGNFLTVVYTNLHLWPDVRITKQYMMLSITLFHSISEYKLGADMYTYASWLKVQTCWNIQTFNIGAHKRVSHWAMMKTCTTINPQAALTNTNEVWTKQASGWVMLKLCPAAHQERLQFYIVVNSCSSKAACQHVASTLQSVPASLKLKKTAA